MITSSRPRLAPLFLATAVAATALAASAPTARAEADFRALPVAWMTATIAMPASAILRQPEVRAQTPHLEATAAPPARLVPLATAPERAAPRRYPEAVLVRALHHGSSAFDRCWSRARRHDLVAPRKARLNLEVDAAGVVRTAHMEDGADAQLDARSSLPSCLSRVGRRLPFPATGKPMTLSLLLLR